LEVLLKEAEIPYKEKDLGKFVYKVRLKGKVTKNAKGKIYVGKTGLHPYERFLHHIRGYKASSHVKRLGTAVIGFEGPMSEAEAVRREPQLAAELRKKGWEVYGGH
jgi:predicted GIY-YIG superfamily endonuclease